jgi:hypothetical protein
MSEPEMGLVLAGWLLFGYVVAVAWYVVERRRRKR